VEVGSSHYKYFIILHILFFISLFIESRSSNNNDLFYFFTLLFIFIFLQGLRIWCIRSLGKFWNTKIIILPNEALIETGPYKYFSHPNYFVVGMELFIIPLLFNAVFTAILFPILHTFIVITKRLPIENKALIKSKKW